MNKSKTTVFGDHERNTLTQLEDVAGRATRAALMADGRVGYVMPIGGVAAGRRWAGRSSSVRVTGLGRAAEACAAHGHRAACGGRERKGVILRGVGLDESPHVYRRLPDVLAVVMAGADLFDPYKD